jgi:hypothetical protein
VLVRELVEGGGELAVAAQPAVLALVEPRLGMLDARAQREALRLEAGAGAGGDEERVERAVPGRQQVNTCTALTACSGT